MIVNINHEIKADEVLSELDLEYVLAWYFKDLNNEDFIDIVNNFMVSKK